MSQIVKIVISGGPCAGKSSALKHIQKIFTEKGWNVLLVSESATELILGGIAPWTCQSILEYQSYQTQLQLTKEDIFDTMAKTLPSPVLIVCDRGLMDAKAYMTEFDFHKMLDSFSASEQEWLNRYDAIFLLETTAKGKEEYYSHCTNEARSEGLEKARQLDDCTIQAWREHPHCFYFDNSTDFDGKLEKLIQAIEKYTEAL